jgi:hypothetical protein
VSDIFFGYPVARMRAWEPERLPVGSVVLVTGKAGIGKTVLLRDLVYRMHERYDESIVCTTLPDEWAGTGCRVFGPPWGVAPGDGFIEAIQAPGAPGAPRAPRLVVVDGLDDLVWLHLADFDRVPGITVLAATQRRGGRDSAVDCLVTLGRTNMIVSSHPAMARFSAKDRILLAEQTTGRQALVVSPNGVASYLARPDPPRPHWAPWTTVDLRACWRRRRTLPHGPSRFARDVIAQVARHGRSGAVAAMAATCRQWRLAIDDVPLVVDVRHSPRFGTPVGVPNIGRLHGAEWDGRLRRLDERDVGFM